MQLDQPDHAEKYLVVVNHEEQYSIWPARRELPSGWTSIGEPASKETCLRKIEEVWTDMRPASLRGKSNA